MNFSDDLEENLSMMIKWLMLVSLVVIVLWGVVSTFKMIFFNDDKAEKKSVSTEMLNEDFISGSESAAEQELQDLEAGMDESMLLDEDSVKTEKVGNQVFVVNVKEIPENLYFGILMPDGKAKKKREIINKKIGENYIDSVLSYGTLERWNPASFPLKVYIKKNPNVPHTHVNELKSAFIKWQERTNNFISFVFVDKIEEANVICSYPENFNRTCASAESSETSHQYFTYDESNHIDKSYIELTYKDCNGEKYADDIVYAFALKEVGHSLGLRGHSGMSQADALFYSPVNNGSRPDIHNADINTLKLVYSVLPDKTNSDFSEEQLEKLIRPEDVWGDKVERTASSEKAILYNIEKSPDIPALHIALGNHYTEKGKFDKALEVYSRGIVLLNDAEFKSRVYVRVGDTYSSQSRYMEAAEAYKLSLKNLSKKQNLFNVYFNLGYIYYQQGKYDESIKAYQTAIQYVPSKDLFFKLLMDMSVVYLKIDNLENAQKCAEKAFSLSKTPDSVYLVAYIKYLGQEYETAQQIMESLVEQNGTAVEYGLLAQIYYKTKQYEELQALSEEAAEKFPQTPPFSFK